MSARPVVALVALREELGAIREVLEGQVRSSWGGAKGFAGTIRGIPVVAARTGMGAARAAVGAREVIEAVRPGLVVATGFAGGLRPELRCGDIVVAREVWEVEGEPTAPRVAGRWSLPSAGLHGLERATGETGGARRIDGRLVSVTRVLATREEKAALGTALDADAADMESAAIARVAEALGVRAIFVRVVLDDAHYDLPIDFEKILDAEGRPRILRIFSELGRRPMAVPRLLGLARRAWKARASLKGDLPSLLQALA